MKIRKTVLLLAALATVLASACTSQNGSESANRIEEKFKDIKIQTTNEKQLLLTNYLSTLDNKKPIVLITWKHDCAGCKKVIENLILERDMKQSFELVTLNLNTVKQYGQFKTKQAYAKMKNSVRWNCNNLYDSTGSYIDKLYDGRHSGSEIYIIKEGEIYYFNHSSNSNNYRKESALIPAALLSEKKPVRSVLKYDNGKTRLIYGFDKLRKSGIWTAYYENGRLVSNINYVKGKIDGPYKYYYENGKSYAVGRFEQGEKNGDWKLYYNNGQLRAVGKYKNDELEGPWKYYYENGKTKAAGDFTNGKKAGRWKYYFKSGKTETLADYQDGKNHGNYQSFYSGGKPYAKGNYAKGEKAGKWVYYYSNGNLKKTGRFVAGKRDGGWKEYYENGQLEETRRYANGKADGEWKLYFDNGQLYQTQLWKNGRFMDLISCFDGKGSPLKKGTLTDGNGTVISYYKSGKFKDIDNYLNGKREKNYKWNRYVKELQQLVKKSKRQPLHPYSGSTIRFISYPLQQAVFKDSLYYLIIPLDISQKKWVQLMMKNARRWRIFTNMDPQIAGKFRKVNFKNIGSIYLDGKKIHPAKLSNIVLQGGKDIDMDEVKDSNIYLAIIMSPKKYKKQKENHTKIYLGYYAFNNEKKWDNFQQKLKRLE